MRDRIPLYPGRVKLTPVDGQANTYDMVRADEPTQIGTPLNKATLLKDTTAASFGLGEDAVPDDALATLGKYAMYAWKRRTYVDRYSAEMTIASGNNSLVLTTAGSAVNSKNTIYYSESIGINQYGSAVMLNEKSIELQYNSFDDSVTAILAGKYVRNARSLSDWALSDSTTICYITPSATIFKGKNVNAYQLYVKNENFFVVGKPYHDPVLGEWEYVFSTEKTAYPTVGVLDGYQYQSIGVTFDRAANNARIVIGSYVGTGTYGYENRTIITADFEIKQIIIQSIKQTTIRAYNSVVAFPGMEQVNSGGSASNDDYIATVSFDYNQFYIYSTSAAGQMNASGSTYYYTIIG